MWYLESHNSVRPVLLKLRVAPCMLRAMAKGGRSDRRRFLVAWICILVSVSGPGIYGSKLAGASQAQSSKRAAAFTPAALGPAAATGAFGLDLMRTRPARNLILSPDSVAAALAMAGTGATGRTAAQIARVLHLSDQGAFGAIGNLQRTVAEEQAIAGQGHPKAPTLGLANGLFLQQGFPLEPTFLAGLQEHFGAAPEAVDFSGNPSGSVQAINAWVSDHTKGIISALLESLPESTRLALANAVYLKANWLYPFDPAATARAPFHDKAGSTPVELMHETEPLRYGSGRGYKAVALPYRASTLSLLVVLPMGKSIAALQRQLGTRGVARIAHGLSRRQVRLSLPRFHLTAQTNLNSALRSLGMTAAFGESADFSGMTTAERLKIGVVEHAADLRVGEEGTVAAAATVVTGIQLSEDAPTLHAVAFNANRSFLFFLRDDRTGAVLFAGRLTNMASAGA